MTRIGLKISTSLLAACVFSLGVEGLAQHKEAEMDTYISGLMDKMTLQEKIGQLNLHPGEDVVTGNPTASRLGAVVAEGNAGGTFNIMGIEKVKALQKLAVEKTRLGIPLIFGMDLIHGYQTVFPIPLGMSASWDIEGIENSARISAREASATGACWAFSPMVDIARDPRWGRMSEGSGEDPYLGSEIARAVVRGYQGDNMKSHDEIMACVKHYALYGAAEGGRDYNTVDMSRQSMYNNYFPPYKAAVEAGVGCVMTSFNTVDGIPATANKWLVTDVLRDQWGFDGFVVTDYESIYEMAKHGVAQLPKAAVMSLTAGTDMDMSSYAFLDHLEDAVKEGKVSMEQIDTAVRRVLEAKYKLGLFQDPYKYIDPEREKNEIYTEENRKAAREMTAKTFVLLKNDRKCLPLKKSGKIALIGPMADNNRDICGTWSMFATPSRYKTLLQSLKDAVGEDAEILYAKGCNFSDDPKLDKWFSPHNAYNNDGRSAEELLKEALEVASESDVIVAAIGEGIQASGESASRCDLRLPATQQRLLEALLATGKPIVMLNFSGRATVMDWEVEHVPAILNVWFGGSETGDAIADVLFGEVSPSGKLTVSMPRHEGQIPIHYNHLPTGRPASKNWDDFQVFRSNYIDMPPTPLFPFGYGLSYTDFDYSNLELSSTQLERHGTITATVTVTNTGDFTGDEIVQLYIRDLEASISQPMKLLKHFERISLRPGESRKVSFEIKPSCLGFYDNDLEYVVEPGEFLIMAGPDSERLSSLKFTLTE